MRGNSMLSGFVARLRSHRLLAMMAAGLIVLQAILAGLAGAQAAAILAANLDQFAVICHGGADHDDGTVPNAIKIAHLCCAACTAGPSAATLPEQPAGLRSSLGRVSRAGAIHAAAVPIAERAARAGQSQAPPRRG
jgi:hypothetical protein